MQNLSVLISGIICGLILCQAAVVAPLIFKSLNIEQARPLLRGIFPILFKVLAVMGVLLAATGYFLSASWIPAAVGLTTLVLAVICVLIIPATNRASDEKDNDKFKKLHRLSVQLTFVILLSNLCWLFLV